jgi:hypothetical protein
MYRPGDEAAFRIAELLEQINDLETENESLRSERTSLTPREVLRFGIMEGEQYIGEKPEGAYVLFEDYEWMADYADRLVEFGNLPCLPADLENLRESNAAMATELEELKSLLAGIKKDLTLLLI